MQNAICASVTKQVECDPNAECNLRECLKNGQRARKQFLSLTATSEPQRTKLIDDTQEYRKQKREKRKK